MERNQVYKTGMPSIPSKTIYFVSGGTPSVGINDLFTKVSGNIIIAPVPSVEIDASGFQREKYEEDTKYYSLSGYYPSNFYKLEKSGQAGSLNIWKLTLFPFLYDAYSSTVNFADSLNIQISTGMTNIPGADIKLIPEYAINRNVIKSTTSYKPVRFRQFLI